jgi:YopT peptidase
MPEMMDFLINHLVMNISNVREAAAKHNGQCTWAFSQCQNPVRSLIGKSSKSAGGICEILAAKWVCEGVRNSSLQTWLTTANGSLDQAKLSLLAQVFGTGSDKQEETTEAWMRANGVPPRDNGRYNEFGGSQDATCKFDPENDLLGDIKKRAGNNKITKPLFALITINEENRFLGYKGHIMAVKVEPITGNSYLYFDPNFGEFSFNSWGGFKDWFLYYFRKSHYQKFMGKGYKLRYF